MYEPEYEPDDYYREETGDHPCDRCDSPCEYCDRVDTCLLGPDLSDRPDYEHMKVLCYDPETGKYPDLASCQRDYYSAARHCGMDTICDHKEEKCPFFNGTYDHE